MRLLKATQSTPMLKSMSNQFNHVDGMRGLLLEVYELNERIMTGDLVSAKAVIAGKNMKKVLNHYPEAISEDGASDIHLQAYVAYGGWIGITFSYILPGGFCVQGSTVPRRV